MNKSMTKYVNLENSRSECHHWELTSPAWLEGPVKFNLTLKQYLSPPKSLISQPLKVDRQ